jgi:hypothetical protein
VREGNSHPTQPSRRSAVVRGKAVRGRSEYRGPNADHQVQRARFKGSAPWSGRTTRPQAKQLMLLGR